MCGAVYEDETEAVERWIAWILVALGTIGAVISLLIICVYGLSVLNTLNIIQHSFKDCTKLDKNMWYPYQLLPSNVDPHPDTWVIGFGMCSWGVYWFPKWSNLQWHSQDFGEGGPKYKEITACTACGEKFWPRSLIMLTALAVGESQWFQYMC